MRSKEPHRTQRAALRKDRVLDSFIHYGLGQLSRVPNALTAGHHQYDGEHHILYVCRTTYLQLTIYGASLQPKTHVGTSSGHIPMYSSTS